MKSMPIDYEVPITQSIANGVTTAFPHAFTVLEVGDLVVKVDTAGVITYPVFGSDYTVTGLGSNSGSVVFSVAPAASAVVTRYRDTKLKRTTDYQENGDLLADTLDADIDRLWMALQERVAGGTISPTAIRVPVGEAIAELPKAADRALRVLAFDSLGAPLLIAGVDSGSAAALALDVASASSATKGAGQIGYNAALSYLAGSVGYTLKALAALCAALPWSNITDKPTTLGSGGYGVSATDPLIPRQLQAPTVTQNSGALGIGLAASVIDFRSATLTSGATSTISSGALSLSVPSGATLGTTSGQQARIAILAINNAGVVELAVQNAAGGALLDESGLISTTAISGGSTSAAIAYSTTARSNVPYRVVGVFDATNTAGAWGSPALVQGAGGLSVVSLASSVFGATVSTVTGSRAFGTTYYNTTAKKRMVYAWGQTTSSTTNMTAYLNGSTVQVQGTSFSGITQSMTLEVPPGMGYSIGVVNMTLQGWVEV